MFTHLKKFWEAISTGWVLEYPEPNSEPRDFFDRKDRRPQGVGGLPRYEDVGRDGSAYGSGCGSERSYGRQEEGREDAVFRWSEQMKAAGR